MDLGASLDAINLDELISQDNFETFSFLGLEEMELEKLAVDINQPAVMEGIHAQDLTSLLEQFEEASQSLDDLDLPHKDAPVKSHSLPASRVCSPISDPVSMPPPLKLPITPPLGGVNASNLPTAKVLDKIRSKQFLAQKRKSTIMLPIGVPTKRSRSQATSARVPTLPVTSSKLERILSRSSGSEITSPQASLLTIPTVNEAAAEGILHPVPLVHATASAKQILYPLAVTRPPLPHSPSVLTSQVHMLKSNSAARAEILEVDSAGNISFALTSFPEDQTLNTLSKMNYAISASQSKGDSHENLYTLVNNTEDPPSSGLKQYTTVRTRCDGIPESIIDSVLDHDYCASSPRRVIVDEFDLDINPSRGQIITKPLHRVKSLPAMKTGSSLEPFIPVAKNIDFEQGKAVSLLAKQHSKVLTMIEEKYLNLDKKEHDMAVEILGESLPIVQTFIGENAEVLALKEVKPTQTVTNVISQDNPVSQILCPIQKTQQVGHQVIVSSNLANNSLCRDGQEEINIQSALSLHDVAVLALSESTHDSDLSSPKSVGQSLVMHDCLSSDKNAAMCSESEIESSRIEMTSEETKAEIHVEYSGANPENISKNSLEEQLVQQDFIGTVRMQVLEEQPSISKEINMSNPSKDCDQENNEQLFCQNVQKDSETCDVNQLQMQNLTEEEINYRSSVRGRRGKKACPSKGRGRGAWKPGDSPINEDTNNFFDKIPSYYTALSIPTKTGQKQLTAEALEGLSMSDFIPTDQSPPHQTASTYNKLPAYHSCFTNSTKYDGIENDNSCTGSDQGGLKPVYSFSGELDSVGQSVSRTPSRSRSRSSSRSRSGLRRCTRSSSSSDSSWSGSASRRRSRRYRCTSSDSSRSSSSSSSSKSRSRTNCHGRKNRDVVLRKQQKRQEQMRKMEERKIMYVGRIPEGYTRRALRKRFERFGKIEEVSVHFRETGDNYGFVTFYYTCDAYAAIDRGNSDPNEMHFDLCFGGRRHFCSNDYADLDGNLVIEEEYAPMPAKDPVGFDELLKQAQQKLKKKR